MTGPTPTSRAMRVTEPEMALRQADTSRSSADAVFSHRTERPLEPAAATRVVAWSMAGVGFLLLSQILYPGGTGLGVAPAGAVAWIGMIFGIAGIWLVPGLWMTAVVVGTGVGPTAWLATRIGSTLAWYVLVAPVIHEFGRGARITTNGIIIATVAATSALCLGVLLGALRRPADPKRRILVAGIAGAVCAQIAIWLALSLWTHGMNYEHIRRLDWLIVLGCALLAAVGVHSRPHLPARTSPGVRRIAISFLVVAITAVALVFAWAKWSPEQRMPSSFAIEQLPTHFDTEPSAEPEGADLAFALTALGPEGSELIKQAAFTATDDTGRPVGVDTRMIGEGGTADRATLLVKITQDSQISLCANRSETAERSVPTKVTVRDEISGVLVQAVVSEGWCRR